MDATEVRRLRSDQLLVLDAAGGVALIGPDGWTAVEPPLADLIRRALEEDR